MSEDFDFVVGGYDEAEAIKYNDKAAVYVGWYEKIPEETIDFLPALANDPIFGTIEEKAHFARAVFAFQQSEGFPDASCDGMLGPQTWEAILRAHDAILDFEHYYVYAGKRIKPPRPSRRSKVIAFDKSGGIDLHKTGHFARRPVENGLPTKPRFIVVHWGGLDPHQLGRVFAGHRKVSSHFGCGRSEDGTPLIYQYLDLSHVSWHAGWMNKHSVGLDIAQQPTVKFASYYAKKAYDLSIIENESKRPSGQRIGQRKILTLDSATAEATRDLVLDLCQILDIPLRAPRGTNGFARTGPIWHGCFSKRRLLQSDFSGVVGHHHLSAQKWDIACWWDAVFAGTPLS